MLKITKQSLARVLKQLIDTGHIIQVPGTARPQAARTLSDGERQRAGARPGAATVAPHRCTH